MRDHHSDWAAELAALQTDGPAPPDVPCDAYERCTGTYIAKRSVAKDVAVPVGSVSVLKLIRNVTAAAMTRHKKTYAWISAHRDGGVLRVYAKVSTNPSGLRNVYSRGFRNDLKSTAMFASATAFDEWARACLVWPYVPSAVVCCINASIAAGCTPYVRFAGSMHAVRMAGELVVPGSVPRESTPGPPIVVHTQHAVKMYTHVNQTELLIATDVGKFGIMACPRYSAPYANTSAFTLTRLPDGRSREFEKVVGGHALPPAAERTAFSNTVLHAYMLQTHDAYKRMRLDDPYIDGKITQVQPCSLPTATS